MGGKRGNVFDFAVAILVVPRVKETEAAIDGRWTWGEVETDGLAGLEAQGTEGGRPWIHRLYETSSGLVPHLSLAVVGVVRSDVARRLGTAGAPQLSIALEARARGSVMGPWGLANPALGRGPGLAVS